MTSDNDYVKPDNDLSDADWKVALLSVIGANGKSIHYDNLQQAFIDCCDRDSDEAGDLISDALQEGYLQTDIEANLTATPSFFASSFVSGMPALKISIPSPAHSTDKWISLIPLC